MKITGKSHLDHSLTPAHVDFIRSRFGDRTSFFIETVDLPDNLESLPCGLLGPTTGQEAVLETEVKYVVRGNRSCASRVCDRPAISSRKLTVIGGPSEGECILYTAYGGPLAPREPGDLTIGSWEEVIVSRKFWSEHALANVSRV